MNKKNHHHSRRQDGQILSVHAPDAKEVFLAGTFNDWNPKALPMHRTRGGEWAHTLDLPPGRYEYKFVIDGHWCSCPASDAPFNGEPGCVPNEYGTMNRVLFVQESEAPMGLRPQFA